MTTLAQKLTHATKRQINWKEISKFSLIKFTENTYDMIVTIVILALLLSYLLITQPQAAIQYSGYIIIFYVLMLTRRVVQDFDDAYTNDEIGERIDLVLDVVKEMHRMLRNENISEDDVTDIEERLNAMR